MTMIIKAVEAETLVGMARVERAFIEMGQSSSAIEAQAGATVHAHNFSAGRASMAARRAVADIDQSVAAVR